MSYISVFILVSSISYRYTSTGLATVVFFSFFFSFFTGATVSAKLALSVPFACCRLSCFYEIDFYEQIK